MTDKPATVKANDFGVSAVMARRLHERLLDLKVPPVRVLNMSVDGGAMGRLVPAALGPESLGEGGFDAVVSNLWLAGKVDAPEQLWTMGKALKPDGMLLFSVLGYESFRELRVAGGVAGWSGAAVGPFPDLQAVAEAVVRMGFTLPVLDREVVTLTFDSWDKMMAARAGHGVKNGHPERVKGLVTVAGLERLRGAFEERYKRADGKLELTLEVIFGHALRPASWQPQPLPRGSGKVKILAV